MCKNLKQFISRYMYHNLWFKLFIIPNMCHCLGFKLGTSVVELASDVIVKTNNFDYSSQCFVKETYLNVNDIIL